MLRTVTLGPDRVVERLEIHDEANWRTSHSMLVPGPFPMTGYFATIRLSPAADGGSDLSWTARSSRSGRRETAAGAVRDFYNDGIALLQDRFAA